MRLLEFLRKTWAPVCVTVAIAAVTAACRPDGPRVPDIVDHINSIDLSPRFPNPPEASGRAPPGPRPTNYYGTNAPPMRRFALSVDAGSRRLHFDVTPRAVQLRIVAEEVAEEGIVGKWRVLALDDLRR